MARVFGFVALVAVLSALVLLVMSARNAVADRREGLPDPHQASLTRARRRLRRAERGYTARIRRAEADLARAGQDAVMVEVGPVLLGPCTVTVHGVVHELSASTTFTVDVEGKVEHVVADQHGQQKEGRADRREVFLTITGDRWADVVQLPPSQIEGARRLQAAGAAAVRNLATARAERQARMAAAQEELDRVRSDTAEMDQARMTLEDLAGIGPRTIDVPRPPDDLEGSPGDHDSDGPDARGRKEAGETDLDAGDGPDASGPDEAGDLDPDAGDGPDDPDHGPGDDIPGPTGR